MAKLVRKRIIEEVYEEPTDEIEDDMDDSENDDEEVGGARVPPPATAGLKKRPTPRR